MSPSSHQSRVSPASHEEERASSSTGGKSTIVIDDYIPIQKTDDDTSNNNDPNHSFPCLASFRGSSAPKRIEKMKLTLKKRKKTEEEPENEQKEQNEEEAAAAEEEELVPELFADGTENGGRLWHGQSGYHEMYSDFLIGVRNKKTGKMKLVQVGSLYSMRPYILNENGVAHSNKSFLDEDEEKNSSDDEENGEPEEKDEYFESRKELLYSFGGQKSISMLNRIKNDKITESKINDETGESINNSIQKMKQKDHEQGINHNGSNDKSETTEYNAPPHDNQATTAKDAYPLMGLLSTEEMISLEQDLTLLIETYLKNTDMGNPGWNEVVWKFIKQKFQSKQYELETEKIQLYCAINLHYLINIYNGGAKIKTKELTSKMFVLEKKKDYERDIEQDNEQPNQHSVSNVHIRILRILLDKFTSEQKDFDDTRTRRVKTPENLTDLRKYILLMWLYMHDFDKSCGQLDQLLNQLDISDIKFLLIDAVAIGCKVKKQKSSQGPQVYRISLPVPLTFPPVSRKHRGRSRKRLF